MAESAKTGLVISGGGINGAFAVGALIALRKAGVRFDAVSGTSAGALACAAWSADSLERAEEYLLGKRPLSVKLLAIAWPLILPSIILRLFAAGGVAYLKTIAEVVFGIPCEKSERLAIRAIMLSVLVTPLWWCPLVVAILIGAGNLVLYSSVALLLEILGFIAIIRADARKDAVGMSMWGDRDTSVALWEGWPLALLLIGIYMRSFNIVELNFLNGVGGVIIIGAAFTVTWAIKRYLVEGYSLLSTGRLEKLLLEIFRERELNCPTYAMAAYTKSVFDPDNLTWRVADARAPTWHHVAMETSYVFPYFQNIQTLPGTERVRLLLASAALPLGLLRSVRRQNVHLVDGCMIANSPLFPLLRHEKCRKIVHINLSSASVSMSEFAEQYRLIDRLLRIEGFNEQPCVKTPQGEYGPRDTVNVPPIVIPWAETFPPCRIFEIWIGSHRRALPVKASPNDLRCSRDSGYSAVSSRLEEIRDFLRA